MLRNTSHPQPVQIFRCYRELTSCEVNTLEKCLGGVFMDLYRHDDIWHLVFRMVNSPCPDRSVLRNAPTWTASSDERHKIWSSVFE